MTPKDNPFEHSSPKDFESREIATVREYFEEQRAYNARQLEKFNPNGKAAKSRLSVKLDSLVHRTEPVLAERLHATMLEDCGLVPILVEDPLQLSLVVPAKDGEMRLGFIHHDEKILPAQVELRKNNDSFSIQSATLLSNQLYTELRDHILRYNPSIAAQPETIEPYEIRPLSQEDQDEVRAMHNRLSALDKAMPTLDTESATKIARLRARVARNMLPTFPVTDGFFHSRNERTERKYLSYIEHAERRLDGDEEKIQSLRINEALERADALDRQLTKRTRALNVGRYTLNTLLTAVTGSAGAAGGYIISQEQHYGTAAGATIGVASSLLLSYQQYRIQKENETKVANFTKMDPTDTIPHGHILQPVAEQLEVERRLAQNIQQLLHPNTFTGG